MGSGRISKLNLGNGTDPYEAKKPHSFQFYPVTIAVTKKFFAFNKNPDTLKGKSADRHKLTFKDYLFIKI